jgi:hypothetical protein
MIDRVAWETRYSENVGECDSTLLASDGGKGPSAVHCRGSALSAGVGPACASRTAAAGGSPCIISSLIVAKCNGRRDDDYGGREPLLKYGQD